MNTVEIKVTIKEEQKKVKVYDFTESIKALEKIQEISSATIEEVNDAICNVGMQNFDSWLNRLHKELMPILNNHGVMLLLEKPVNFGYAIFKTIIKEPGKDEFILEIKKDGQIKVKVVFSSSHYEMDSHNFFPEDDLRNFSQHVEFVHDTIMQNITHAIKSAKEKAEERAKEKVQTLENLLNM